MFDVHRHVGFFQNFCQTKNYSFKKKKSNLAVTLLFDDILDKSNDMPSKMCILLRLGHLCLNSDFDLNVTIPSYVILSRCPLVEPGQ